MEHNVKLPEGYTIYPGIQLFDMQSWLQWYIQD